MGSKKSKTSSTTRVILSPEQRQAVAQGQQRFAESFAPIERALGRRFEDLLTDPQAASQQIAQIIAPQAGAIGQLTAQASENVLRSGIGRGLQGSGVLTQLAVRPELQRGQALAQLQQQARQGLEGQAFQFLQSGQGLDERALRLPTGSASTGVTRQPGVSPVAAGIGLLGAVGSIATGLGTLNLAKRGLSTLGGGQTLGAFKGKF